MKEYVIPKGMWIIKNIHGVTSTTITREFAYVEVNKSETALGNAKKGLV